jgi:hypothetical protein
VPTRVNACPGPSRREIRKTGTLSSTSPRPGSALPLGSSTPRGSRNRALCRKKTGEPRPVGRQRANGSRRIRWPSPAAWRCWRRSAAPRRAGVIQTSSKPKKRATKSRLPGLSRGSPGRPPPTAQSAPAGASGIPFWSNVPSSQARRAPSPSKLSKSLQGYRSCFLESRLTLQE